MNKFTQDLPAMYGDHHVIEVRRILLEIPGVDDVYASSAFRVVEVNYDPEKVTQEDILAKLNEAGYAGDMEIPIEKGSASQPSEAESNGKVYMRHTAVYEQVKQAVSFGQNVTDSGRPLWPCPGMGPIKSKMEE